MYIEYYKTMYERPYYCVLRKYNILLSMHAYSTARDNNGLEKDTNTARLIEGLYPELFN